MVLPVTILLALPLTSPIYWPFRQARVDRFCAAFSRGGRPTEAQIRAVADANEVRVSFDRRYRPDITVWASTEVWLKLRRMCELRIVGGRITGSRLWTTQD